MHCKFTDLETALRDQLVCGLRDEKLQQHLFAKKELTFNIALEEAMTVEAADLLMPAVHMTQSFPRHRKLNQSFRGVWKIILERKRRYIRRRERK